MPDLYPPARIFWTLALGLICAFFTIVCVQQHSWACAIGAAETAVCLTVFGFMIGNNGVIRALREKGESDHA